MALEALMSEKAQPSTDGSDRHAWIAAAIRHTCIGLVDLAALQFHNATISVLRAQALVAGALAGSSLLELADLETEWIMIDTAASQAQGD